MNALRRVAGSIHRRLVQFRQAGKVEQADVHFMAACMRLEMHQRLLEGSTEDEIMACVHNYTLSLHPFLLLNWMHFPPCMRRDVEDIAYKFTDMSLGSKIQYANDAVTVQVVYPLLCLHTLAEATK